VNYLIVLIAMLLIGLVLHIVIKFTK